MNINKFDWEKKRDEIMKEINYDKNELRKYVLNEKNIRITRQYIETLLGRYGIEYVVNDIEIFQVAMTHRYYTDIDYSDIKNLKMILMGINYVEGDNLEPIKFEEDAVPLGKNSYEVFEFIGDSIIRTVLSIYISKFFSNENEGFATKLRSEIENKITLSQISKKIELYRYVLIPRNLERNGDRDKNSKILCDIFEAFIGALYYDAMKINYNEINTKIDKNEYINVGTAFGLCYNLLIKLIEENIDLIQLASRNTNYKEQLLQYFHKMNWGDPLYGLYDEIKDKDNFNKKIYTMYVRDNEQNIIGKGKAKSKQEAEKKAALDALKYLGVINNDEKDEIITDLSCINI